MSDFDDIEVVSRLDKPSVGDLKIWWIPQVPMKPFFSYVTSVDEGRRALSMLADYDLFQLENNIKPDYCNVGGLMVYESDTGEGEPGWSEWYDEETGNDVWGH